MRVHRVREAGARKGEVARTCSAANPGFESPGGRRNLPDGFNRVVGRAWFPAFHVVSFHGCGRDLFSNPDCFCERATGPQVVFRSFFRPAAPVSFGEVAERFIAPVLKTGGCRKASRGFESLPLRHAARARRSGSGLQNRVIRFDSGWPLHLSIPVYFRL